MKSIFKHRENKITKQWTRKDEIIILDSFSLFEKLDYRFWNSLSLQSNVKLNDTLDWKISLYAADNLNDKDYERTRVKVVKKCKDLTNCELKPWIRPVLLQGIFNLFNIFYLTYFTQYILYQIGMKRSI